MMEKNSETVEVPSPWSSVSSAENEHPSPISRRHTHKEVHGDTIASLEESGSNWTDPEKGNSPVPGCSGSEQPSHSVQPELLSKKLEQLKSDQELNQKIMRLEQELAQGKAPESQPESEPKLESKEDNDEADVGKEPHEQQRPSIPVLQPLPQPAAASLRQLSRESEASGNSSYDSDNLYNATPIATPNRYRVLFERKPSDQETGNGLTDEPLGQQSQTASDQPVDITPGQEKEYGQSETTAQTAAFVSSANNPMRDDNGKQNKESDAPAANQNGPSRPSSPEEGQETSTSPFTSSSGSIRAPQIAINPQAPLFITMDEAADGRFRPFIEEAAPIPGEHMADTMTRDQIRRCEVQLERPLTNQEREVIRAYYRDMRQRRAPDEASIPSTIYSLAGKLLNQIDSESTDGNNSHDNTHGATAAAVAHQPLPTNNDHRATGPTRDTSTPEYLHGIASRLEKKVKALEGNLKETANQRIADRFRLGAACQQVSELNQQKHAIEEKLTTIAQELRAAKAELDKLRADGGVTRAGQTGGFTSWLTLAFAMVVLVWFVTEAMLHSKRLSDGFGPYINGGYNGLGSVLIFGSWFKFLVFNATALYLGYFSILGLGLWF